MFIPFVKDLLISLTILLRKKIFLFLECSTISYNGSQSLFLWSSKFFGGAFSRRVIRLFVRPFISLSV